MKQQTTKATAHVEKQTTKMSKSYSKVGTAIKGMLAALSIAAILAFGKSCIDLGSDLAEVQNVVDVTFGSMSKHVDAFSKNAITQFGLSELTAKKYMGTYGAMAKSFGIVEEAGYQMSAAITGLTGDVASFYNLSTDEAYTKLKSIFTGETESLKNLGIVMTQSALDQFALANGFGKTTAKMSEQEKVMLRYKFVMEQLTDASGDFTRTSDGWANQTRVLALQFDSLKATLGQGLINVLTPVIQIINTILGKLQTLAEYFKAFTQALFGHAGGGSNPIADASDSMSSAAGSSGAVADNMGSAAKSAKDMKKSLASFDEIKNIGGSSDSGSGGGSGGGGGAPDFGNMGGELFGEVTVNPEIEATVTKMKEAIDKLKDAAKPTTDAIQKLWDEGLARLGGFTWTALSDFYHNFLVPLGSWALGDGFPRFLNITNDFLKSINWDAINTALRSFWDALAPFAINVGVGLLNFYQDLLAVGADFINVVVPGGINAVADALNKIDPETAQSIGYGLGAIATAIVGFKGLEKIYGLAQGFLTFLTGNKVVKGIQGLSGAFAAMKIPAFLTKFKPFAMLEADMALSGATLPQLLKTLILTPITTFFTVTIPAAIAGAAGTIGTALAAIGGVFGLVGAPAIAAGAAIVAVVVGIVSAVILNWDKIRVFFTETIPAWWTGTVVPFFQGIPEWFSGVWKQVTEFFQKHWDGLIEWFKGVPDKIGKIIDDVVAWFDELPGKIGYAIGFAIGTMIKWVADIVSTVSTEVPKIIAKVVEFFTQLPGKSYDAIIKFKDNVVKWGSETWSTFSINVDMIIKNVVEFFAGLPGKIYEKLILFKETIVKWKNDAVGWAATYVPMILNSIIDWFNKLPSKLVDIGKNMFKNLWNGMCSMGSWLINKIEDFFGGIGEGLADALGIGKGAEVSVSAVQKFANGGFPNHGQMFVARENGPEMVGRIGGRTAVANNDQIVDAVAKGVYAAIRGIGSGGDEESLYRAFKRALDEVELKAVLDSEKNFRDNQKKAREYKNKTGKPAFGY